MPYDKTKYFQITDDGKLKTSEILAECRKHFEVYCYNEENVDTNFPPPKKASTRYFLKTVEADEANKNQSANDLEKAGVDGITLRERLLMELDYFEETGEHLDVINWTLCSGSRYSGGPVPGVSWRSGPREVAVRWFPVGGAHDRLRARAVVSNPLFLETLNPSALPQELTINGQIYRLEK